VATHYVALPADWSTYTASLSPSFRSRLRRTENRLSRLGTLSRRIYAARDEIGDGLAHLLEIDADSWRQQRGEVINENENLRRYYADLSENFAGRGQCWINVLFLDKRALSAVLTFMHGQEAYAVKTCYRAESVPSAASPGLYALYQAVGEAVSRGARRCHFLSAKPTWGQFGGAKETVTSQLVYHPSLYGRLLSIQEKMLRRARVVVDNYMVEERI
jgi:CelD/BcsL family acetyltransferase involved in cellulose biosynthesis